MSDTKTNTDGKAPEGMRLSYVRIKRVENGHIGSVGFEMDPDAKNASGNKRDMCCPYVPDKEYVLADHTQIHEFIDKALGMKAPAAPKARRFGNAV